MNFKIYCYFIFFRERRALVKSIVKAANVILLGLLMYNLWNNKWTKLNFNKKLKF